MAYTNKSNLIKLCILLMVGYFIINTFSILSSDLDQFLLIRIESFMEGINDRSQILLLAVEIILSNPIFGIGSNCSALLLSGTDFSFFIGNNFHNHWITILVERGIIGFLPQLFLFIYLLLHKYPEQYKYMVRSILFALLITSLSNNSIEYFGVKFSLIIICIVSLKQSKEIKR